MSAVEAMLFLMAGAAYRRVIITVGNDASTRRGWSAAGVATGPGFGAITPHSQFYDNSGTLRTMGCIYWRSTASELVLAFPTGSPPNSDLTFRTLTVGSAVYQRAAISFYGAWSGPGVAFSWLGRPDPFGPNGAQTPVTIF